MEKQIKKLERYLAKHVWFSNGIHVLGGVGIGILVTYPMVGVHPVRWGLAFLGVAILGHLWALTQR
jgi:hypothetical protein